MKKLSRESEARIIELYQNGLSIKKIHFNTGHTKKTISKVLNNFGIRTNFNFINDENSFWVKLRKGDINECWNWSGCKNSKGYGYIRINGKRHATHRLAYEYAYGKIPERMFVCHTCDNPSCCNPKHLVVGTPSFNLIDSILKNRRPMVKLDAAKVHEIRSLHSAGTSISSIAKMFSIDYNTTHSIIKQNTWYYI